MTSSWAGEKHWVARRFCPEITGALLSGDDWNGRKPAKTVCLSDGMVQGGKQGVWTCNKRTGDPISRERVIANEWLTNKKKADFSARIS
jgi:hypothetical protein